MYMVAVPRPKEDSKPADTDNPPAAPLESTESMVAAVLQYTPPVAPPRQKSCREMLDEIRSGAASPRPFPT